MARKKSDNEIFMEIVFKASAPDCQQMIETLKAKIRSTQPKKERKKKPVTLQAAS